MNYTLQSVKTRGFKVNYMKFGNGPDTMVILPGLSIKSVLESADFIESAYRIFEDRFTVYLFDRREELPEKYSVYGMAADTTDAIKELNLNDIYLFGASQGGMISMALAADNPGLVRKLALGSTSCNIDEEKYSPIASWVKSAEAKERVKLYLDFGEKIYTRETYEKYRDVLAKFGGSVTDEELRRFIILAEGTKGFRFDEPQKITCPVFVIGAEDDGVLGPGAAEELAELFKDNPGLKTHIYRGYGHAAFDTAPDYKERLLEFFLS